MVTSIRCAKAQLPGPTHSEDRVFLVGGAVIVLDGASAFRKVDVSTGAYVETLGQRIAEGLRHDSNGDIADIVGDSIHYTANFLRLRPINSPSSTVAILRAADETVDLYVLGDTAIYYGNDDTTEELIDSRLSLLGIPEHARYRERLAAGHGYDQEHRDLMNRLQRQQRQRRNRRDGYWIAETDQEAAYHAIVSSIPAQDITWAVLATDGAYKVMDHLGLNDWCSVGKHDDARLLRLLQQCAEWELKDDADGQKLPRSKVSDDKTLVAVRCDSKRR